MTTTRVGALSTGFSNAVTNPPNRKRQTVKPNTREDGELYARPEPNPFTFEWRQGYEDGLAGESASLPILSTGQKAGNYWDGLHAGEMDRRDADMMGSSNA